jgi:hypothetical protein
MFQIAGDDPDGLSSIPMNIFVPVRGNGGKRRQAAPNLEAATEKQASPQIERQAAENPSRK